MGFLSPLIYEHLRVLKILAFPSSFWIVPHAWYVLFGLIWSCFFLLSVLWVEAAGLGQLLWNRICRWVEGKPAGVSAEGGLSWREAVCQHTIPVTPRDPWQQAGDPLLLCSPLFGWCFTQARGTFAWDCNSSWGSSFGVLEAVWPHNTALREANTMFLPRARVFPKGCKLSWLETGCSAYTVGREGPGGRTASPLHVQITTYVRNLQLCVARVCVFQLCSECTWRLKTTQSLGISDSDCLHIAWTTCYIINKVIDIQ